MACLFNRSSSVSNRKQRVVCGWIVSALAKIAYILLCHKDPEAIIQQAHRLTAVGDYMAIHFDARAKASDYRKIREALDDNPNVAFAHTRIKCGWGNGRWCRPR